MGNTGEDADASRMKTEKKKKKSKDMTNNLLDVFDGDDNTHVEEIDGGLLKEKKDKHKKKKKKESKSKEEEGDADADASPVKMEKKKKKKKKKKNKNGTNDLPDFGDGDGNGNSHVEIDDDDSKEKGHKHKKKRKKESELTEDGDKKKRKKESELTEDGDEANLEDNGDLQKKSKKRKRDSSEKAQIKENNQCQDDDPKPKKQKKKKNIENDSEKPKSKSNKKPKKVTFSSHVEIFPSPNTKTKTQTQNTKGDNLVRGKRFTPEEDGIIKQAVENYIISNNLGDDGLQMILNCRSHKGMKKCWQEIACCIPYRPYTAVYYRAHILFEQSELRKWTPEEINFLKESHKKHGNKWKLIAEELGKHRFHVKDTWRRIKFDDAKNGRWSQDEYQNLYDMVNLDLQMKITEQEKKSKHGMLRDNIPWTAFSEKLTRSDASCCVKWYKQLTSSLVAEKKWMDADDYWLVGKLYELDAACVEDVDWDDLLEHRSGEICRKRWDQMVVCIGNHKSKTFGEQVDILAKRYRPELAETRQIWDDKPVVP